MLFLPECFGFMGENAEQTMKEADPPIVTADDDNDDSCCTMMMTSTPFRQVLDQTITNAKDGDSNENEQLTAAIASLSSSSTSFSIIDELRYIAYKSKMWISGGGVHTRVTKPQSSRTTTTTTTTLPNPVTIDAENKIYNTHVIIDDQGQIQAYYHKIHLFDVSIPNKVELRESNTTSPGSKLVVCDSPIGKLGLSICYDMRFAEMYVELVQKGGAQVLLMPSAFTVPTGRAHWHALLRGEVGCFECD